MYKILIVDDEKIIRTGIKNVLTWENMKNVEVLISSSGKEALEIIEQQHPEIMITDINMTEMSGLKLIEEVRRTNSHMRIIVLTGYDKFEYAQKCLRMSVVDFLLKPIEEAHLIRLVKEQIVLLEKEDYNKQVEKQIRRTEGTKEQLLLEQMVIDLIHLSNKCKNNSKELVESLFSSYNYPYNKEMQIAVLIPAICTKSPNYNKDFIMLSMKNICVSMIDAREKGISIIEEGKIILIFFVKEQGDEIIEQIEELIDILKDEYGIGPKVVMGSIVKNYQELFISYNDAMCLLENECEDIKEIIRSRTEEKRVKVFREIFGELKNIIGANVGNPKLTLKTFQTFKKATLAYNLSNNYVRRCCFEIASTLYFSYISESGEMTDNKISILLQKLTMANREKAYEITSDFITQLLSSEDLSMHEIIVKAQIYIEQNLEEELSVAKVAAIFFLTPNYFSRLFKRVVGEGCNEYMVRKRIEKAKYLLETTNIPTGRIAGLVGYRDNNYFSLAFKKHTGESPTKFRDNIRK